LTVVVFVGKEKGSGDMIISSLVVVDECVCADVGNFTFMVDELMLG
jgi:hypothetical protein